MSLYTIDSNRPTNSHDRDNFSLGTGNTFVFAIHDSDLPNYFSYSHNIVINYNRDIIIQNPQTYQSPDFRLATFDTVSIPHIDHTIFGFPNTIQYISGPPSFIKYSFGTGEN